MALDSADKKGQNPKGAQARKSALERIRAAQDFRPNMDDWARQIRAGNREVLGQAITLTESNRMSDLEILDKLLHALVSDQVHPESLRIGITGVPGVGKSTFIEQFGEALIEQGHRVAVLAIDPSSSRTGGSILGDKTRMERLAQNEAAFVRPSPTGSSLGGVTRGTSEAIVLCEAAGYDRIIIETVGVGQSETAARELTDAFILLMLPGGGDELQGIKRGIMEMADLLLVNKCDSGREMLAEETANQYRKALHLFPPNPGGHEVDVMMISALEALGIQECCVALEALKSKWITNGWMNQQRSTQRVIQFRHHLQQLLFMQRMDGDEGSKKWGKLLQDLEAGSVHPFRAAREWMSERLIQDR